MKAVIIAAGYATRLYPLTENFPKALLDVGGRTILDRLVDQITESGEIDQITLVTNSRFAMLFEDWKAHRVGDLSIEVMDDGTTSNENRLGAVADIQLAIDHGKLDDDLFVAAADNVLLFDVAGFIGALRTRRAPHVCVRHVETLEARRRTGIAVLGGDNRITEFQEKPQDPKTAWGVPPLYLYPRETLPRFAEYLSGGGNPDAPGNFVEWLSRVDNVYGWKMDGTVLDIGNVQSLEAARKRFAGGNQV